MKLRRHAISVGLLVVMATSIGSATSSAEPKLSIDRMVEFFEIVVFGSDKGPPEAAFIRKWQPGTTLTYKLCGNAKSVLRFRSIIEKHARTLAQETGLNFREVPSGRSSEHFAFWFAEPNEMIKAGLMVEKDLKTVRRAAFRARCYFLTYTLQTGAYIKSLIVINRAQKSADLEHCLLEEMTQVLGLPNDNQLVSPSIFNDNERHMELTRIDRFLLRTLYDDRMLAGTPRKLALILARGIMLDLGEESGWAE